MRKTILGCLCVLALAFAGTVVSQAAEYTLTVKGQQPFKIFVKDGNAHYTHTTGSGLAALHFYEVTTTDDNCVHHLGMIFLKGNSLSIEYDLCKAPPLEITTGVIRF